ncbi:hypothetical protein ACFLR5_01445 [Elusimicrobiota bacterium]
MNNKSIIIISFIITTAFADCLGGAFDNIPVNAKPVSKGTAGTASGKDINSVRINPAALAELDELQFLLSYRDFYGLDLISQKHAALALPGKTINAGLSWDRVNTTGEVRFLDYSEDTFMITFSGAVPGFENFLFGTNFKFYQVLSDIDASGYGFDVGFRYNTLFNGRVVFGLFGENINTPGLNWSSGAKDHLKALYRAGICYLPGLGFSISADYDNLKRLNAGFEIIPLKQKLSLRAGIKDALENTRVLSAGFGYELKKFTIDYALSNHRELGMTHFFTLLLKIERL